MKNWRMWLIPGLIVAGVSAYVYISSLERPQTYDGTELKDVAADFKLADQNGSFVRLSDIRGKIVVLTFMDSQCKDTCPLTAADLRQANRQLNQKEVDQVIFLGVNVNIDASAVADVLEATKQWHLDEIPSWHFLTGNREELKPVWKDYDVAVVPNPDGSDIMHTPGVYVIDPSGNERWYISTPYSVDGNAEWTQPLSNLLVNHIREILSENK